MHPRDLKTEPGQEKENASVIVIDQVSVPEVAVEIAEHNVEPMKVDAEPQISESRSSSFASNNSKPKKKNLLVVQVILLIRVTIAGLSQRTATHHYGCPPEEYQ